MDLSVQRDSFPSNEVPKKKKKAGTAASRFPIREKGVIILYRDENPVDIKESPFASLVAQQRLEDDILAWESSMEGSISLPPEDSLEHAR
jgi:hypothetical protein